MSLSFATVTSVRTAQMPSDELAFHLLASWHHGFVQPFLADLVKPAKTGEEKS